MKSRDKGRKRLKLGEGFEGSNSRTWVSLIGLELGGFGA